MVQKTEKKKHRINYAVLKQKADDVVNNIKRDFIEFATRNVTAETVTAFEDIIRAFDNIEICFFVFKNVKYILL